VPGPKQTLYVFGAPLREIHPLVPLAAEHAVGVAALSYDGNVGCRQRSASSHGRWAASHNPPQDHCSRGVHCSARSPVAR